LRVICGGASFVNEHVVNGGLKRLKWTTRFRRHRFSLAKMLNPAFSPVSIPSEIFFLFLKLFRIVECGWQHGGKHKLRERRVFFSYPYVFYQLCFHLDKMEFTGAHHLLCCDERLNKLHYAYGRIAKQAGLRCTLNVHR